MGRRGWSRLAGISAGVSLVAWAGAALGTVIVQVALGIFAHSVPALGMLHGAVALVLLVVALIAARKASGPSVATDADASTGAHAAV